MRIQVLLLVSFCLVIFSHTLFGQTELTGKTIDQSGQPLGFANVLLLNPADSSLIRGELSDAEGRFRIQAQAGTRLILSTSFIGYSISYSDPFTVPAATPYDMGDFILSEGLELDEVQVVARKPLYEQKIDRMVVNVSNSVTSAGLSALEVLERSPGVNINRQSNAISLLGKQGVGIMINGKISYQPVDGIVQMLSGMSSDNIEKIELITAPPAHLDAEGNAGYINIVLINNPDMGLNGNTSLNAGYGNGETGSANINFNYRKNRMNLYGNYSYFLKAQKQLFRNYRETQVVDAFTQTRIESDRYPTQSNHRASLGLDLVLSDRTTMGLLVSGYDTKWTMDADNYSSSTLNMIKTDSIYLYNYERNQWKHLMGNINLEHRFSDNEKLALNYDRLHYEDENPVLYELEFFDAMDMLSGTGKTRSDKYTPLNINVFQIDYSNELTDYLSVQAGIKGAFSSFTNDVIVDEFINGQWQVIDQFTNESDLSEKVYAAYFSGDYKLDDSQSLKIGMRYEYTDSELNTDKEGRVVDREFGKLFPTVYYYNQLSDKTGIGFAYNRRITRPTFNQMAPFTIFLDPSTVYIGNAALQPAISDNIKIDYRLNSFNLSIQYSREDSTISRFQDRFIAEEGIQAVEATNLSNSNVVSGSLAFPVYLTPFWEMQNNIIGQWQQTNSYYEGRSIRFEDFNYNVNTIQSFLLPHRVTVELTAEYYSGNLNGRARMKSYGGVNLGVQKKFDNGSSLRLGITDIFDSVHWDMETELPEEGIYINRFYDFSNRTFSVNFTTAFGNKNVEALRSRKTASEDERSRVN